MSKIVDDKSEHVIPFLLEQLSLHREKYRDEKNNAPPLFVGLNGIQGAGKTTLVDAVARTLRSPPYSLPTFILSIDDLYLPHDQLLALAASHPNNPLVQHRGQPSTHDIPLGVAIFSALRSRQPTKIPVYDKSRFNGQGDRVEESQWEEVNGEDQRPIEVVILEGWCVGFRALGEEAVGKKWREACRERETDPEAYNGRLGLLKLEDLMFIDQALKGYAVLTNQLQVLIHMDAEDTHYVYEWRLEFETTLRKSKGSGMTDEQVRKFVNDYYPSYELYTDVLRQGCFQGQQNKQLWLIIDKGRSVKEVKLI